jgi:UDP-N-acetylmuramyl tripeptide synthase
MSDHPRPGLRARSRIAVASGRAVAAASRLTKLGSGSVIGGRVSLFVDRHLLRELSAGRDVALVSATNGKTTTTRLLVAALSADRPVVSNTLGANMPPGHVAALGRSEPDATAVLEVDERWLGAVMAECDPSTVVLMNLSRDQLDRSHEVRDLAARWRAALVATPPTRVIANADDPLVAWAATGAPRTVWVAAGSSWRGDAVGCPSCGARLSFDDADWRCGSCSLARPHPDIALDGDDVVFSDGTRVPLELALPGRVNRMNAAIALAAASAMGADAGRAAVALADVHDVAGRYLTATVDGCEVRLLLAKNPAGWHEALDMLAPAPRPVIVSINARVADGHDPSWLWDVPFGRLAGRDVVVATGERRLDLAVRLRYAGVDHVVATTLHEAVAACQAPHVDVAANYTAFQEYLEVVG